MTPVQAVFELLKVATPMPATQRESLMGDAEEWFRTLGMQRGETEPSKLELSASKILKSWWFMTLLAILFIPAKRYVLDYLNGNHDEDDEDDEDDQDDDDRR